MAAGGAALRDLLENATRELDAIWGRRLPPDTSLPVILHPLESGYARSALFESLIELESDEEWRDESATLLRSASACQLDPERALRAGHAFVIEDPLFCGWLLLALEACSQAWEKLGDTNTCLKLRIRSEMIADGVASRLWWEEQELYVAWNRGRQSALRAVSAGGLLPAASRTLLEEGTAKRAIDRHLRPATSALWGARGVSQAPPRREGREERERDPTTRSRRSRSTGRTWCWLAPTARPTRASRAASSKSSRSSAASAPATRPAPRIPTPTAATSPSGPRSRSRCARPRTPPSARLPSLPLRRYVRPGSRNTVPDNGTDERWQARPT